MEKFSQKELEYLRGQQIGRIATVSKDQIPQVTAVAFATDEEKVYLNIQYDSKKARNIGDNPRISFIVDDCPTWETFRGVLISGKAQLILKGKSHQIGIKLLYKKYPKYQKDFSIEEGVWSKYILVITPTKIKNWGPIDNDR